MGRPRISGTLAAWAGTGGRPGLLWVLWARPCSLRWQAAPECFSSWPSLQGKLLYCHPPPGMDAKLFQQGLEQLHPSKEAAAQRNGQQLPGRGPKAKQMEDPMDLAFFHQVRQGEASGGQWSWSCSSLKWWWGVHPRTEQLSGFGALQMARTTDVPGAPHLPALMGFKTDSVQKGEGRVAGLTQMNLLPWHLPSYVLPSPYPGPPLLPLSREHSSPQH